MFDFAWSEIAVLGVIALVVIGPKDLPRALKTAGFMVRRARGMAREFQNSVDDMIRESELQEIREQAAKAAGVDLNQALGNVVDPGGEIRAAMAEPGAHAVEASPPPPAVAGSAIGELPTGDVPHAPAGEAVPALVNPEEIKPLELPAEPEKALAETHRTLPAP